MYTRKKNQDFSGKGGDFNIFTSGKHGILIYKKKMGLLTEKEKNYCKNRKYFFSKFQNN